MNFANDERETPSRTAERSIIQRELQEWLQDILKRNAWSAYKLAKLAGIAPTSITRLLNDPAYNGLLSTPTITAIEKVAGVPAPSATATAGFTDQVAPYQASGDSDADRAVQALLADDPNRSAWRIFDSALTLAGQKPGDIAVVDTSEAPRAGDVVLAQIERANGARTVFRLYAPPMLIGATMDPTEIQPELVDGTRVRIAGVRIAMLRIR